MPKFDETLTTTGFFRINDLPYQKGDYSVSFDPINETASIYKKNIVNIGEFTLVEPTVYSSWTNSSGTPYASFSALVTDLELAFFF